MVWQPSRCIGRISAMRSGTGCARSWPTPTGGSTRTTRCGSLVLTGTPPAFCAGADLGAGERTFAAPGPRFSAAGVDVPAWSLSKPVIAAVNGHALGLGLTLALQCDIRFFAADAKYGVVQVRRGVVGDAYSHWVLPRLVGLANAAEILLTGATFDGHRAVALGLGSRVLDAARGAARRAGAGARHRREHRADVGGGQQAAAVGFVRPRPRRGRRARDRDPPAPDGPRRRQGGRARIRARPPRGRGGPRPYRACVRSPRRRSCTNAARGRNRPRRARWFIAAWNGRRPMRLLLGDDRARFDVRWR